MNLSRFRSLARQLRTIPGGPQSDEDFSTLAEDLAEQCHSEQEAEWVVGEARRTWF